jgi:hypothetical protein
VADSNGDRTARPACLYRSSVIALGDNLLVFGAEELVHRVEVIRGSPGAQGAGTKGRQRDVERNPCLGSGLQQFSEWRRCCRWCVIAGAGQSTRPWSWLVVVSRGWIVGVGAQLARPLVTSLALMVLSRTVALVALVAARSYSLPVVGVVMAPPPKPARVKRKWPYRPVWVERRLPAEIPARVNQLDHRDNLRLANDGLDGSAPDAEGNGDSPMLQSPSLSAPGLWKYSAVHFVAALSFAASRAIIVSCRSPIMNSAFFVKSKKNSNKTPRLRKRGTDYHDEGPRS